VSFGASHTAVVLDITSGGRRIKGQLWTWGNGAAATGQSDAAHSALPRYFNFTKKGNQNNVAVQVACGDNFTAVLDEDAAVTVIGVSPVTNTATREPLELPKEDDSKTSLDVESISAGGSHICLVMAERTVV
jgi:alpha-tubulin suppressor-like RCC1 family protein